MPYGERRPPHARGARAIRREEKQRAPLCKREDSPGTDRGHHGHGQAGRDAEARTPVLGETMWFLWELFSNSLTFAREMGFQVSKHLRAG